MHVTTSSRWQRHALGTALAAIALVAFGSVPAAADTDPDPDRVVTFAKDVAPILQESCQACHRPGSVAPMSLLTYDEVRPWAQVIKLRVQQREMPPYHYDTDVGIQELKYDTRLSEAAIETIALWVDQGAPMGNPADLPPPLEFTDETGYQLARDLGQPDLIVKSTPYTVPATGQDIWHRPLVETGLTQDRCIKAIEVRPMNRAIAHHANSTFRIASDDSADSADDDGNNRNSERLTEYALGKLGEIIPEGTCRIAPADAKVSWDIHYFPSGEEVVNDHVEIGIWFYPESYEGKFRQDLRLYGLQGDILLPPHGTAMTQGFHSFDHPVRIDSFQPHGHLRLKAKSLEIFHPGTGDREMISMVSNWNPGWHLSHIYEDHVAPLVPAGSVLVITAWYDNTANNSHNPDPDVWVGRGSRTTDEMSHAWIALTHLDQAEYDRLVAEREAMEKAQETTAN
ncbi:MAG TPA: hypothetical protein VMN39_08060 [Longimicrobiaceae bacterium]|nr:hypothetical protein [Longimicrobiaceae bacterium]